MSVLLNICHLCQYDASAFFCRSNIPVILMGETGCGKTRLIKYMCALAKQGKKLKTFFMLKVLVTYYWFYMILPALYFILRYMVEQQMLKF